MTDEQLTAEANRLKDLITQIAKNHELYSKRPAEVLRTVAEQMVPPGWEWFIMEKLGGEAQFCLGQYRAPLEESASVRKLPIF